MYLGEIRIFACNFEPEGWATCDGQIAIIARYTALYAVIGTIYGGDGRSNFAFPMLQGQAAMHWGAGQGLTDRYVGEFGGESTVTIQSNQMPAHTHTPAGATPANSKSPKGEVWSVPGQIRPTPNYYARNLTNPVAMANGILQPTGNNLPHNNLMPYLGITFCISLNGIFPNKTVEP